MKKRSKSSQIFARETRLRASSPPWLWFRPDVVVHFWSQRGERERERELDKKGRGEEERKKERNNGSNRDKGVARWSIWSPCRSGTMKRRAFILAVTTSFPWSIAPPRNSAEESISTIVLWGGIKSSRALNRATRNITPYARVITNVLGEIVLWMWIISIRRKKKRKRSFSFRCVFPSFFFHFIFLNRGETKRDQIRIVV